MSLSWFECSLRACENPWKVQNEGRMIASKASSALHQKYFCGASDHQLLQAIHIIHLDAGDVESAPFLNLAHFLTCQFLTLCDIL